MTDQLLIEQRGRVLIKTFNNPEMRNALSPEIYKAAFEALDKAENEVSATRKGTFWSLFSVNIDFG